MNRFVGVLIGGVVAVGVVGPAAAAPGFADPPLSEPIADLEASLHCPDEFTDAEREPVLLVHGTFTNEEENWSWNYGASLPAQGWDVCTVTLPSRSLDDIQVASEYVVHAIREIHARSGDLVDVIGHSQGVLEPRWALRWWPSLRDQVDDLVGLAGPNHGTVVADAACAFGECGAAASQMTTTSDFIRLLNSDDESPGDVSYTSIYTATDELVQPVVPTPTAAFEGAANIMIQDLCPGRPVDHVGIAADAVAYALTIDALVSPGPASVDRFDITTCASAFMPGVTPAPFLSPSALERFLGSQEGYAGGDEPEPAPYTRGDGVPPEREPAPEPAPDPAPGPALPATGGGLALAAVGVLLSQALRLRDPHRPGDPT